VGYLGVTVVVAALVVAITFGSFGQLAKIQVKAVWLLLAGLVIQIVVTFVGIPQHLYDSLGYGLIMFSYVLILAFCFVNIGIRGIGLITIGVAMNALVIGLNQGMPTRDQPITTASGRHIKKPIEPDVKHRPERSSDLLPFLSDIIWLPAPFDNEAISFGDLILAVGICELAYSASRRRYTRGGPRPEGEPSESDEPAPDTTVVVDDVGSMEVPSTEVGSAVDPVEAVEVTADGGGVPDEVSDQAADESAGDEAAVETPSSTSGRVALTPTLDQRMGMSAPRRSRTRSRAPSTRPS
jgi:hypothetical protein